MSLKMWIGNLDGSRQGLVIAASKSSAAKAAGMSLHTFNGYFALQTCVYQGMEPDVLYTRPYAWTPHPRPWIKGKCPL